MGAGGSIPDSPEAALAAGHTKADVDAFLAKKQAQATVSPMGAQPLLDLLFDGATRPLLVCR